MQTDHTTNHSAAFFDQSVPLLLVHLLALPMAEDGLINAWTIYVFLVWPTLQHSEIKYVIGVSGGHAWQAVKPDPRESTAYKLLHGIMIDWLQNDPERIPKIRDSQDRLQLMVSTYVKIQ